MRYRHLLIVGFLVAALIWSLAISSGQRVAQPTCAETIDACPLEGCSSDNHHDPRLNRLKNITALTGALHDRTLDWIKDHEDPKTYQRAEPRDELTSLGEGERTRVVGYLLRVKLELGGESCNCYFRTADTTDNHLVLVTRATVDKFPITPNMDKKALDATFHSREAESITAEFTPRVRKLAHPHFVADSVQPLIETTPSKALLVRITGQLMFDSEHFFQNRLNRMTNWEIHPIFRLEYCPAGKACSPMRDANWKDLDH